MHTWQWPGSATGARRRSSRTVFLLLLARFVVDRAAFEQLGERASEDGDVTAAGTEQLQVLLHRPAGEHAGARQVQADGVDPVLIGDVEQQVADQQPRFGLRRVRVYRVFLKSTSSLSTARSVSATLQGSGRWWLSRSPTCDQVEAQLQHHYAVGRLTLPELEERVVTAYEARTREQLHARLRLVP
ncbi:MULTISPECIES: DUF1707 domain-containing protein [unclassified Streptomyces]|uniref:DUF1707 SHOCT-like domain-containing protein n=1 Tax=unclassified Streptomyces TaxID=2593676 RepID=UPI00224E258F|nr:MULTISPECIES: DUF1707 domain-containing protein [unclassified Streptomyces]MCX4403402.1 DUF1707 domain-containing protein [Streptomyces sp. NBC_01764]MCX5181623.1 DUF1707 domain-containing protein [Streptomyces sp. NBC_00268]